MPQHAVWVMPPGRGRQDKPRLVEVPCSTCGHRAARVEPAARGAMGLIDPVNTGLGHPALISEADFVAVRGIRAARGSTDSGRRYRLAGLLCCGICGCRLESCRAELPGRLPMPPRAFQRLTELVSRRCARRIDRRAYQELRQTHRRCRRSVGHPLGFCLRFCGPERAGKTTTIRILLGLVRPTSGNGIILGGSLDEPASYLHKVGALIESPARTRLG
jgi:hypothetical protein